MEISTYLKITQFKGMLRGLFSDEDINKLTVELNKMAFFTAPASTKYHGNYMGGLFDHSYEVTKALVNLTEKLDLRWCRPHSPYIVGLFHDLCKTDAYVYGEGGRYEYNKEMLLTGHGDKSVILAQKILSAIGTTLTTEEILCIRWHMGAFDDKENWSAYGLACTKYPNVLYAHTADMIASKIVGI